MKEDPLVKITDLVVKYICFCEAVMSDTEGKHTHWSPY